MYNVRKGVRWGDLLGGPYGVLWGPFLGLFLGHLGVIWGVLLEGPLEGPLLVVWKGVIGKESVQKGPLERGLL